MGRDNRRDGRTDHPDHLHEQLRRPEGLLCRAGRAGVKTSSNAHEAFEYAFEKGDKVLFLPDKHLGRTRPTDWESRTKSSSGDPWDPESKDASKAVENDVILWDGYCQVHERFRVEHIEQIREGDPDAKVIVHPECRREVVEAADKAGSTATICETVENADAGDTWAIGTEIHLTHHLQRWHPEVNVLPLCGEACMDCNAMRQIDPNYLTWVLEELVEGRERNVIEVAPEERGTRQSCP